MKMRRREFITGLSSAVALPLAARAQQPRQMRRIGVIMFSAADDPESQVRVAGFLQGVGGTRLDCRQERADRLPLGKPKRS
jgi:hypothetical protein